MKTQLCLAFGIACGLTLLSVSNPTFAEGARKYSIHSKLDQFDVLLSGNTGRVAGKTADLTTFNEIVPMLTNSLGNECPTGLSKTADATVKEGTNTRLIYLKEGIVKDGENCLNVAGDGLLYFPTHRDFLIGPKNSGINVTSPIKIFKQGTKVLELVRSGKTWKVEGTDILVDWDFLDRFRSSLASYTIRFRAQLQMSQDKPKMIVQIGGQSYEFYKVTGVIWALKRPGAKWLEASDDWSFWYDFDNGVLQDHLAGQIEYLKESGHTPEERLAAMNRLDKSYSRNLRELYHHMILQADESEDVKRLAFQRLRQKPVKETALVMARYLQTGDVDEFKRIASQILKINNPKGPIYNSSDSPNKRAAVIEYWRKWAQQNP